MSTISADCNIEIKPLNLKDHQERSKVIDLYEKSFPDFERKPFSMIIEGIYSHKMKAYSIYFNHEYVGLAFLVLGDQAAILDYLAIHPDYRNRHLGSMVLSWLIHYEKPFFVEIESTLTSIEKRLPGGSSKEDALRRKKFYLENGLIDCHQEIYLFKAHMELLASKPRIDFRMYWQVMSNYLGLENLDWAKENVHLIDSEAR